MRQQPAGRHSRATESGSKSRRDAIRIAGDFSHRTRNRNRRISPEGTAYSQSRYIVPSGLWPVFGYGTGG